MNDGGNIDIDIDIIAQYDIYPWWKKKKKKRNIKLSNYHDDDDAENERKKMAANRCFFEKIGF